MTASKEKKSKTGIIGFMAKIGFKVLSVALKGAKFLKFALAAITLATYSYMFTWKFALLIMLAIGWHESGHVWAIRKCGYKTRGFYFLPFLGGVAVQSEACESYTENAFIVMMGPIWGLALAALSCLFYYSTGLPLFAAAAAWMAMINIFNLFPINPLDGGQLMRDIGFSISRAFGIFVIIASMIAASIAMYEFRIGLFGFILILGALDLFSETMAKRRRINHHIERRQSYEDRVEEYRRKQLKYVNDSNMYKFYTDRIEEYTDKIQEEENSIKNSGPKAMNKKQIATYVAAYALTILALIVIVKLMEHTPGASLAATFLAD